MRIRRWLRRHPALVTLCLVLLLCLTPGFLACQHRDNGSGKHAEPQRAEPQVAESQRAELQHTEPQVAEPQSVEPQRTQQIARQYFYDLNTGELFEADITLHPPIEAPSGPLQRDMRPLGQGGPAGVRARVFSCTDCSDRSSHFIGYLEMYPPEVKRRLEQAGDQAMMTMEMDAMQMLIRRPDDERWVASHRPEYAQILQEVYSRDRCPDGQRPRPCHPHHVVISRD